MSFFEIVGVVLRNLIGYDLLILLLAAANVWIYLKAKKQAEALYGKFHLDIHTPSHVKKPEKLAEVIDVLKQDDFASLRVRSERWYGLFTTITAIFPLMGILGTVLSLLPMVADMTNLQVNFFEALTSTFWGLVFAIVFKFLDGFLASMIEDNDKNVTLLLSLKLEGDDE